MEDVNSVVVVPTIYEDYKKTNPSIELAYIDLLANLSTPPRNKVELEIPGISQKVPATRMMYGFRQTMHRSITDAVDFGIRTAAKVGSSVQMAGGFFGQNIVTTSARLILGKPPLPNRLKTVWLC